MISKVQQRADHPVDVAALLSRICDFERGEQRLLEKFSVSALLQSIDTARIA